MATMQEILDAIAAATDTQKAAFKNALGVSDSPSPTMDAGASNEQLKIEESRYKVLMDSAKLMNDMSAAREAEAEVLKRQILLQAEQSGMLDDAKKDLEKLVENGEELGSAFSSYGPDFEKLRKQFNDIVPMQEQIKKLSGEHKKNISDIVDGMGGLVGLTDKYTNSFVGQMTSTFRLFQDNTEEGKAALKNFQDQFATMFSIQNIAMNIASGIFEQSMKTLRAYDDAAASLAKTTGTVGKFNNVLYDAQRAGNLLDVSMSDVANSITALNAGTSTFAKLNESTQTQIAISTSQFEKLGVSAQDTADFMENAFKIMNMGATEAVKVQKELAMAGVQLGIGADKIVKDFNAASKTLAVYGKGSVDVFKDLAAQAKAAGVEVSTLLGIVQKFDTFSGAAEGAAQFNALLGTQLSTTQMLMMTEDERMKTLVESVQAQGVAFGDMDRFTQKAIAAAAGITDMNEANRIFGMSLADYEANANQMQQNADAQAKFDEAVQATVPTMNKFKNLATEMITLVQPALETLGDIADYLTDMFQGMSKETKELISGIALFVSGLLVLAPIVAVGGGLFAGLSAIGPAIAGIGTGVATAISSVSAAIAGSAGIGAGVLASFLAGGAIIGATMAAMAESEAKVAESNAKMMSQGSDTIQAMRDISTADFSSIATRFGGVIDQLNSMGTDVEVTSMLQNLALVSSGTAMDLTGAKITASTTNLNATFETMFDGATINLKAGGKDFEAYIEDIAAKTSMSV